MSAEMSEGSFCIPIRRTRWVSFRVGVAAVIVAFLLAATTVVSLCGLLMLLSVEADGVWVIFLFGLLWFGLFFLSYPLQRRYSRSRDLLRPGISLTGDRLVVPLTRNSVLHFKLDEPHELMFGWYEHVMTSVQYQGTHTRAVWTHAILSQAGQCLYLIAEDSVREAQSAGWPKKADTSAQSMPRVSLWASDLVTLIEAIRGRPVEPVSGHRPSTATDRAEDMAQANNFTGSCTTTK